MRYEINKWQIKHYSFFVFFFADYNLLYLMIFIMKLCMVMILLAFSEIIIIIFRTFMLWFTPRLWFSPYDCPKLVPIKWSWQKEWEMGLPYFEAHNPNPSLLVPSAKLDNACSQISGVEKLPLVLTWQYRILHGTHRGTNKAWQADCKPS